MLWIVCGKEIAVSCPVFGGSLLVAGAEYSLETGVVDFFYGLPEGT